MRTGGGGVAFHAPAAPAAVPAQLGRIDAPQPHPLTGAAQGVAVHDVRRRADEGSGEGEGGGHAAPIAFGPTIKCGGRGISM